MHWQPAESGPQPALGRGGGLSARVCPHADEAVSGRSAASRPLNARLETDHWQMTHAFLCSNTVILRLVPYTSFTLHLKTFSLEEFYAR